MQKLIKTTLYRPFGKINFLISFLLSSVGFYFYLIFSGLTPQMINKGVLNDLIQVLGIVFGFAFLFYTLANFIISLFLVYKKKPQHKYYFSNAIWGCIIYLMVAMSISFFSCQTKQELAAPTPALVGIDRFIGHWAKATIIYNTNIEFSR